jgi:hypothetical protein
MDVIEALRAGRPVLLPADGVYGLCALAESETAVHALYALKGRGTAQPTQVIAASVDTLVTAIPELSRPLLEALLPGAYTLVLPNPAQRLSWLTGRRPGTIGVRVAHLPPATQDVLDAVRFRSGADDVVADGGAESGGRIDRAVRFDGGDEELRDPDVADVVCQPPQFRAKRARVERGFSRQIGRPLHLERRLTV